MLMSVFIVVLVLHRPTVLAIKPECRAAVANGLEMSLAISGEPF